MRPQKLRLENCQVIYKNFSGAKSQFNAEGDRNFSLRFEDLEFAEGLGDEGWNIRPLKDADTQEIIAYHLPVKVSYLNSPPRISTIREKGRQALEENTVGMLDFTELSHVDVVVNPYSWEMNGNKGIKAYLSIMYAIVNEDALDLKYADLPEINNIVPRIDEVEEYEDEEE